MLNSPPIQVAGVGGPEFQLTDALSAEIIMNFALTYFTRIMLFFTYRGNSKFKQRIGIFSPRNTRLVCILLENFVKGKTNKSIQSSSLLLKFHG